MDINHFIYFSIAGMINLLLIMFIFFKKERIKLKENNIYIALMVLTLIGIVNEIIMVYGFSLLEQFHFIKVFVAKSFLIITNCWVFLLCLYTVIVANKDNENNQNNLKNTEKILIGIFLIYSVITCLLPINYAYNKDHTSLLYTYGPSIKMVFVTAVTYIIISLVAILKRKGKYKEKRFFPVYAYIFMNIFVAILQQIEPSIIMISFGESLIILLMYNTIENPDVKMLEQTELAKEQADKANRAKTDFLSSMSHEIRTPLNAIVGFSECIEDAQTIEEAKENAHDIVNASQTLLEIVNGILDISKIEAGKIEIVNTAYNAKETFEDLAVLITPKMNEKGLDFTYKIAPDIPQTLYGDHANIKKIITNLLSNAAKYTDHGFVHYEVHCVNSGKYSKLIITVEDSGRGIKKESVDKLFTKFQRLDEDKNTTIEGTGLGLAITKQLIELMGGKIIVHTIYGEGSKFTVVINQRIEEEQEVEKHHKLDTLDLNNIKILLVDDNALNIKVANKILEKYNANMVTSVSSGFECLDKIKAGEKYDVILLDDMMPKMSGVETLQELKKDSSFKTPVIALTANAITGMREKYINEGFDDYLAKPIEKDQLIRVMNEILGRTITNQIPVEDIKEEVPEVKTEEEKAEEDDKNRILQVSEDDVDLLKNQQLISETTNINLVDRNLDKVSVLDKVNDDSEEEVLEVEEEPQTDNLNVIEVPTDLLKPTSPSEEKIEIPTVEEPPSINPEEYLRGKGVDLDKALENLGDMEMYDATVDDFLSEVEDKWHRIEDYKLQNNMKDYSVEVHSLKSDAKYLGLMRLADIAYQHELASKEDNTDYVNINFNYLEEEYNKALEIIKNYKDQILK